MSALARMLRTGIGFRDAKVVAVAFAKALGGEDWATLKLDGVYYVAIAGAPAHASDGAAVAFRAQDALEYLVEVERWESSEAEERNDFPPVEPPALTEKHQHWVALSELLGEQCDWELEGAEPFSGGAAEACPGCGCEPGDGVTKACAHPIGCGYWKNLEGSAR